MLNEQINDPKYKDLFDLAKQFLAAQEANLAEPDISVFDDNSIDLAWSDKKSTKFVLLINIKDGFITFFGKNEDLEVKGKIFSITSNCKGLFEWLKIL